LRHRRRNNTQTILRKSASNKTRFTSPKKKRSKKPLVYSVLLISLISLFFIYKGEITTYISDLMESSDVAAQQITGEQETQQTEEPSIPTADESDQQQYYSPLEKKVQLEILNGCGESGVAKKLSALLKKSKYDIVNSGNYIERGKINWKVQETKIISQISNPQSARELADLMGILYSNVEEFENPSPIADITVVIGKDYKTLAIFQ